MSLRARIKSLIVPQLNHEPRAFALPETACGTRIPRKLHQVFLGQTLSPQEMPPEIKANIDRIQAINPGWEHQLHDLAGAMEFIRTQYGAEILSYFMRIAPEYGAARADLFRYLLMYRVGGVYLDVKSSVTSPLDDFLRDDDRYILAQWRNGKDDPYPGWGLHHELRGIPGGEFQQWHIMAAPGHPFLKAVILNVLSNIDRYLPAEHGVGKNGVLRVTGPTAYTLAIAAEMPHAPYRLLDRYAPSPLEFSIYGHDAHFSVFKTHYSQLDKPVIQLDRRRRLHSRLLQGVQTLDRTLRKTRQPGAAG